MKYKKTTTITMALLSLLLIGFEVIPSHVGAQFDVLQTGMQTPKPNHGENPFQLTPGPEIKQLRDLLEGHWKLNIQYEPLGGLPGGEGKGREVSSRGPGGLSILIKTASTGPQGPFEGSGIITWSSKDQAYKLHWVTSNSPEAANFDGTWENGNLVFSGSEVVQGQELASRHSITEIKPDSFIYTIDLGPTFDELKRAITIEYKKAD